jgi:PIN domain
LTTNHVLIDYENVQVKSLDLLRAEHFRVYVFLGPSNMKLHKDLVLAMHEFGDRAEYVELEVSGKNALDFHLAYFLGKLSTIDPAGCFHLISKDTGFDPLVQYLKSKQILASRSDSIEAMPCFAKPPDHDGLQGAQASLTLSAGDAAAHGDPLMKMVLDDLVKRRSAKPRTPKTLKSTMQARCGSEVSSDRIEALYNTLVERGYVRIEGTKLNYSLPEASGRAVDSIPPGVPS